MPSSVDSEFSSGGAPGEEWDPRLLWKLWAGAFLLRAVGVLIAGLLIGDYLIANDTRAFYLPLGRSLAAGTGYQVMDSFYVPSRIAPLFPVFLAGLIRLCGGEPSVLVIGLFHAALRSAGAVALFLTARRHLGPRAAAAGDGLYLLDPWEFLWTPYVLKESLAVPLFLGAVLALSHLDRTRNNRTALLVGAAIGVATLARFASGALLLVALCWLFFPGGASRATPPARRRMLAVCLLLGMLLALSPWLIRNWRVTGYPVLSTEFVGRYLYTSNGPGKQIETAGYADAKGLDFQPIKDFGLEAPVAQSESKLGSLALKHLISHPWELPLRFGGKLINMWRPTFGSFSIRNLVVLAIPYVVLMGLSLAGLVLARRERIPSAPLWLPIVVLCGIHLLFWAEIRNRQYLTPLFYAFGGLAVVRIADGVRERGRSDTA